MEKDVQALLAEGERYIREYRTRYQQYLHDQEQGFIRQPNPEEWDRMLQATYDDEKEKIRRRFRDK